MPATRSEKQERPGKIDRDKVFHAVSGNDTGGDGPSRRQGEASWAPAVGDTAGPETFSTKCRTDMQGVGTCPGPVEQDDSARNAVAIRILRLEKP